MDSLRESLHPHIPEPIYVSEQQMENILEADRQKFDENPRDINTSDRESVIGRSQRAMTPSDEKSDDLQTKKETLTPLANAGRRSRSHESHQLRKELSKSGIPRINARETSRDHSKTESERSFTIKTDSTGHTDSSRSFKPPTKQSAWKPPKPLTTLNKPSGIPTKPGVENSLRKGASPVNSITKKSGKLLDSVRRNLEAQYNFKKKKLAALKKDLLEKQRPIMELYKSLLEMRKRLSESEGKELPLEELKVVQYEPIDEHFQSGDEQIKQKFEDIDPKRVHELTTQVQNIPNHCLETCRLMSKKKMMILDNVFNDKGEWNQDVIIKKIASYKEQVKKSEVQIERRLKEEEKSINLLVTEWQNLMMTAGHDDSCIRDELANKLQETEHKLKQAVAEMQFEKSKKLKDIEKYKEIDRELLKLKDKVQELNKTLSEERNKSQAQKERVSNIEQKLKSAKNKIRDTDAARHETETKIDQLKNAAKKAEEQWKAKEVYYENRHKELIKTSKAAENLATKLEKERHSVNSRADEVTEKLVETDIRYQSAVNEKEVEISQLKETIEVLQLEKEQLSSRNENLKSQLIEKESYNKSLFDILEKKRDTGGEVREPKTKLELELWTELGVAKMQLVKANEKLEMYATEKARFIETMRRNEGEGDNLKQLMEKENEISTLKIMNRQLQSAHDGNLHFLEEYKMKVKILEKQNEEFKGQLSEGQRDTQELIVIYQDKLKIALEEYEKCEAELLDLRHRLHGLEIGLADHQKLLVERDEMLIAAQENKNEISLENENLRHYVKYLRCQLTELSQDHAMKLAELQGTYCLLEEKTQYVTQLENTLHGIELKKSTKPNLKHQSRTQKLIQDRSEFMVNSDYASLNMSIKRRNRFALKYLRKNISQTVSEPQPINPKLKPKNFSTTCSMLGDKLLNRDYVQEITIARLTDMIMNTLSHRENQQEFVKHANTLALFEASKINTPNYESFSADYSWSYISPGYEVKHEITRNVVIQFLKNIQLDLNHSLRRIATDANINLYRRSVSDMPERNDLDPVESKPANNLFTEQISRVTRISYKGCLLYMSCLVFVCLLYF